MFDFQMEKSLPTHENYYVNLNDYFIANTYIFNVFFFLNYSCSFLCKFGCSFCTPSIWRQAAQIFTPYSLKYPLFFGKALMKTPLVLLGHYLLR